MGGARAPVASARDQRETVTRSGDLRYILGAPPPAEFNPMLDLLDRSLSANCPDWHLMSTHLHTQLVDFQLQTLGGLFEGLGLNTVWDTTWDRTRRSGCGCSTTR